MKLKSVRPWLLAVMIASVPALAHAGPITLDSADVGVASGEFSRTVVGTTFPDDIEATLDFDLTGWATVTDPQGGPDQDLQLTFSVTVSNTSDIDSLLTSIGFNTNPDAESGDEDSSIFAEVLIQDGNFDVCVQNDTNPECFGNSGNPADGIADGANHTFNLRLYFDNIGTTAVTLDGFFARFQGLPNGASDKAYEPPDTPPPPDVPIPEPGSLILLGSGLLAAASRFRKPRV
jgi:hypothetical protein